MSSVLATLLLLAGIALAQPAGALEGKVLNSATNQPVAGAAVVLQGLDATFDTTGTLPQPDSYVLETDANGNFRVAEIAAGRYKAHAEREGFTAQPHGAAAAAKPYPLVTVEPGQQVQDVILKLIPLGAIAGRAVDADGDPIIRAGVAVMGYSYATGKKELKEFARGFSNDGGEFQIVNIPPGRYYLMFSPNFGLPRSPMSSMQVLGPKPASDFGDTYYPAAVDVAAAVVLDLPPGGELRDKTIVVRSNQTYTIRISVAGSAADSPPMIGLFSPNGMGYGGIARSGVTSQYAGSSPGTYMVTAEDRLRNLSARQMVKVVNSDVDVVLTLRPETVLRGVVRMEGSHPFAVDGVRISLETGDGWFRSEAPVQPDGSFTLRKLQAVNYQVRVKVPAGGYLQSVRLGERSLPSPEVDLSRGPATLAIVVGTDGAQLAGEAVEGATVVAVPAGPRGDWPDLLRSVVAGNDGRFELRDLAPGDYQVFAFEDAEPGAPLDPDFRKPFEKQAAGVHLAPDQHATVRLRAP